MMQEKPYVTPEPEEAYDLTEEEKELNGVNSMEELMKKQHPEGGLHLYNVRQPQPAEDDPLVIKMPMDKLRAAISVRPPQDMVNHPSHYTQGGVECIEALKASMSTEEFRGYLKGCNMKYMWRYRLKNGLEDLKKAQWYLNRLIRELENAK